MQSLQLLDVEISMCAPSGLAKPIERADAESLAAILKAVADPTRLQLISLINGSEGHQACACDLAEPLKLSQPTVSHHLKVLVDAGILNREKRGTWAWYSVNQDRWNEIAKLF